MHCHLDRAPSEDAEKVGKADSSRAEAHSEWQKQRTCNGAPKVRPFKTRSNRLFSAASSAASGGTSGSVTVNQIVIITMARIVKDQRPQRTPPHTVGR